jgi:transposase
MREVLSLDLRKRVVKAYDQGMATRQEVADRFGVSLGMVKKLISQRKRTGDIGDRYRYCGAKPYLDNRRKQELEKVVGDRPDITLEQIKHTLKLRCTIQAIHYALVATGLHL